MNSAVKRQQWLKLSDIDPAAAAEAVARLKANQQTLTQLDFEMAQQDEVSSRRALGLGVTAVIAVGALAVAAYFLPLAIV